MGMSQHCLKMTDAAFTPPLFVVIPVFNGWPQTRQCLQHLRQSNFRDIKVVLVDHGSTDDTKKEIKNFPEVIHITESESLWWTGATNIGVQHAIQQGASHIMLLNNDCYVDQNTIGNLINHFDTIHAEERAASVIAPLQRIYPHKSFFHKNIGSCFLLGFPTLKLPQALSPRTETSGLQKTKLIIGGRGAIVPTTVFGLLGLFDDKNLPHYGADHDFYLRCNYLDIPLFLANNSVVQIDQTRTSTANDMGALTFGQFIDSFTNIRSHRNIRDLSALYKKHYPVRSLYFVGMWLNVLRYSLVYIFYRIRYLLKL